MGEEVENVEAPNWMKELERKREVRVKAKLGHEAGAGAPCLTCDNKCPGLDLHFWRKICKNCKCSKEDHDVHDDDIYGWAQFQLLGSKPNRIKTKIVLPGKKDEVELDWTPKGPKDTINSYLKTLPPESLPVKGSQAAQTRKQLLQKQIPIHDLDPSLCHDLTESEQKQMQAYIDDMKNNSVGVGQVVQLNQSKLNAAFVSNRYPKGVPSVEAVKLQGENLAKPLSRQFEKLGVNDQKELDAFFDEIPNPANMTKFGNQQELIGDSLETKSNLGTGKVLPHYVPGKYSIYNDEQNPTTPSFIKTNNAELSKDKRLYIPEKHSTHNEEKTRVKNLEVNQNQQNPAKYLDPSSLPNYIPGTQNVHDDLQHALSVAQPGLTYQPELLHQNLNRGKLLPHYIPGQYNIQSDQQEPFDGNLNIKNQPSDIRDLAFSTYDPTVDIANSNHQSYNPSQYQVPEDQLQPNQVTIGAIRDITYETPEIKTAQLHDNKQLDPELLTPPPGVVDVSVCKKCKKLFKSNEFAIFVERSNGLYHSDCFRCAGCNQNLADMVYFYDKESDNIYCGRDFAKIRGIPRCKACDELIFVKEYCLAENSTFHVKHFCCFECDDALAGQNYVMEEAQPLCLPCFEKIKANKCEGCLKVIKPDEQGANLNGVHFHATDECFACKVCKKPLLGGKLLLRNQKLYCSHDCYGRDV